MPVADALAFFQERQRDSAAIVTKLQDLGPEGASRGGQIVFQGCREI